MDKTDLNLRLLAGLPIKVENIQIKPKNIREIVDFGYLRYNQLLSLLVSKVEDMVDTEKLKLPEGTTVFDVVLASQNEELISGFIDALCFFFDESTFDFDEQLGLIIGEQKDTTEDTKYINHKNFEQVVDIIKHQNCVNTPKDKEFKPKGKKASKILEKLKKGREAVQKAKSKDGNDIDFQSIVSAVSTKSNSINKLNVWDLTIYQLYDEFKRLEMITGYDTSILAMLNGAEIKDLKHWSSRIEE